MVLGITRNPDSVTETHQEEPGRRIRKPAWLKRRLPSGPVYGETRGLLEAFHLHTVCQEAQCPNRFECFSKKTATFLIMGPKCTRNCRFCSVDSGPDGPPDPEEPVRVARAARDMGLRYVVVTSVTRDDLPDGGAHLFAETIREIRSRIDQVLVEVLIPDFKGDARSLVTVLDAEPDVLNHNIETVPRLYERVRPEADYRRSLTLLARARKNSASVPVKSGIMLGLGEKPAEIRETLQDIYDSGCRIMTIGQYLQPSRHHLPVDRFVRPEEFESWRKAALHLGFGQVFSGPFVRSSYKAAEMCTAIGPQPRQEVAQYGDPT
jgi:lipoyl synthase